MLGESHPEAEDTETQATRRSMTVKHPPHSPKGIILLYLPAKKANPDQGGAVGHTHHRRSTIYTSARSRRNKYGRRLD